MMKTTLLISVLAITGCKEKQEPKEKSATHQQQLVLLTEEDTNTLLHDQSNISDVLAHTAEVRARIEIAEPGGNFQESE